MESFFLDYPAEPGNGDVSGNAAEKELFELLARTSSSLAKRDILIENSENELFRQFLDYLLNPFLITGISAKKIAKETEKQPTKRFDTFTELMEYLFVSNTGTDEVIANIRQFLSAYEPGMREFYISIITKARGSAAI